MIENRLEYIDIAKGIGIILVVVGHTATHLGIEKIIYQFHMPLFFILSGIFFKEKYIQQPKAFIKNKLRRLYVPFVLNGLGLFCIVLVLRFFILENTGWSFLGALKYMLFIVLGIGGVPLGGAFWFLRALLIVSILFLFLNWVVVKIKTPYNKKHILFAFVLIFLSLGCFTNLPYSISQSFIALFFYYLGYLYINNKTLIKTHWLYFIFACFVVIACSFVNSVDMAFHTYSNFLLFIFSAICGTYAIVFISEKIKQNAILEFIGQKSMPIMLFHFLSFLIINTVIVYIYHLPIERLLDYPTIKDYKWWWLLFTFVGVAVSILIENIIIVLKSTLPNYITVDYWFNKLNK